MLKLVTISRISKEKGFERMRKLEGLLHSAGLPFVWDCYGDTTTAYAKKIISTFRHVKFKGVTTTPIETMQEYDYLVQLSDTEGFPYSIYEAMSVKIPVIATDFPSINEMITDGVNGYILNMDLSNFSADKIQSIPVIKSFREKSTEKDWIKFLNMAKKKAGAQDAPKKTRAPRGTRAASGKNQPGNESTNPVSKQDVVNALNESGNDQTQSKQWQEGDDITNFTAADARRVSEEAGKRIVSVTVTRRYHDLELGKVLQAGTTHEVILKRARLLEKEKVATINWPEEEN